MFNNILSRGLVIASGLQDKLMGLGMEAIGGFYQGKALVEENKDEIFYQIGKAFGFVFCGGVIPKVVADAYIAGTNKLVECSMGLVAGADGMKFAEEFHADSRNMGSMMLDSMMKSEEPLMMGIFDGARFYRWMGPQTEQSWVKERQDAIFAGYTHMLVVERDDFETKIMPFTYSEGEYKALKLLPFNTVHYAVPIQDLTDLFWMAGKGMRVSIVKGLVKDTILGSKALPSPREKLGEQTHY